MLFTKMPPVYVYDMVLKKRCCHVTATKLCDPRKCHQFTTWILRGLLPGHHQRPKRMCFQIICSQNSCHNKIRYITKVPNTQQKPLLEKN